MIKMCVRESDCLGIFFLFNFPFSTSCETMVIEPEQFSDFYVQFIVVYSRRVEEKHTFTTPKNYNAHSSKIKKLVNSVLCLEKLPFFFLIWERKYCLFWAKMICGRKNEGELEKLWKKTWNSIFPLVRDTELKAPLIKYSFPTSVAHRLPFALSREKKSFFWIQIQNKKNNNFQSQKNRKKKISSLLFVQQSSCCQLFFSSVLNTHAHYTTRQHLFSGVMKKATQSCQKY